MCLVWSSWQPLGTQGEWFIRFLTWGYYSLFFKKRFMVGVRFNSRSTTHGLSTTQFVTVTGRRHRVSPSRSAYYASPWRLLTLSLRSSREAALFLLESWWHLTVWGFRRSHFMILPNTNRHPNKTKTEQFPVYEVITDLPRPYHTTGAQLQEITAHRKYADDFSCNWLPGDTGNSSR